MKQKFPHLIHLLKHPVLNNCFDTYLQPHNRHIVIAYYTNFLFKYIIFFFNTHVVWCNIVFACGYDKHMQARKG